MAKRDGDPNLEGPPSKLLKDDDGGGRAGRVRKKSAKVLEMEEFEMAEKKTPATKSPAAKKVKTPKIPVSEDQDSFAEKTPIVSKKTKHIKAIEGSSMATPSKVPKVSFQLEPDLTSPPPSNAVTSIKIAKVESLAQVSTPVKKDSKSVIKHLLNSPTAGAATDALLSISKKVKKQKMPEIESPIPTPTKKKVKVKKSKIGSPGEMSLSSPDTVETPTPSLKMKIISSSDHASAIVSMGSPSKTVDSSQTPKQKKVKKEKKNKKSELIKTDFIKTEIKTEFIKTEPSQFSDSSPGLLESDSPVEGKKKKSSKKKEKLIQDAISSVSKQIRPVTPSVPVFQPAPSSAEIVHKKKKKPKVTSPLLSGESLSDSSMIKSDLSFEDDDDDAEDEIGLVIAETTETSENKKKKTVLKKKVSSSKGKDSSPSKRMRIEDEKKITKRAPTAYMLFCNTYRPEIVQENPGIEFATISRKLGEMWQALSNKQKLAWRRKAQTKRKKSSNLISTGKVAKDSTTSTHSVEKSAVTSPVAKSPRSMVDETPQSPTYQNYSIEPIDVAAHLKLLGESLSIIGMRLQEHKGIIAVQGSLSVLLDSLLCACGPLLALTQQVPGLDGCPPLVHAKTMDSVAYVMPGL